MIKASIEEGSYFARLRAQGNWMESQSPSNWRPPNLHCNIATFIRGKFINIIKLVIGGRDMAMVGDLSEFSLADILQMFERASKTGLLSIWGAMGVHRIWFYQGRVIASTSPDKKYHLKQLLVDCEAIDHKTALALNAQFSLSEPIGSYLRKKSLVSPDKLAAAFRQQLKIGLYSLFTLRMGQFRFAANVPLPYEEMTGMSKGGMDAAMEGLRQFETIEENIKDLPHTDSSLVKIQTELPLLKLSRLEWGIWERISPQNPIWALAQQLHEDLLEVRKACLRLMQVGLIEEIPASLATRQDTVALSVEQKSSSDKILKASTQENLKISVKESMKPPISATLLSRLTTVLRAIR